MSTAFAHAPGSSHRALRAVLVVAVVCSALGAAIVAGPRPAAAASATTTTDLNLRRGPGTRYAVRAVMPAGTTVAVVRETRNGYYHVVFNGLSGHAAGQYLDFGGGGGGGGNGGGATGTAYTTTSVNLRAGPSTGDRVLAVMPSGAAVSLTGQSSNGFLGVTYNGTSGWAYASYIGNSGGAGTDGGGQDPGSGNAGTAYTTTGLNLRSGPSTSNRVLLVIPSGAAVTLTGQNSGGFSGVNYNGTSGWASSSYLSSSGGGNGSSAGGDIVAIIYAAADRYGQSRADMLRVARCESGLNPNAYNGAYGASGLFQFLPGTWATTPYANQDIFDPVASANAAGWMWSVGRRGEWVCQ